MKVAVCLFCMLAAGCLTGCWGSGHAKDDSAKQAAFREVMGFAPSASVAEISSSYYYMRDNYIRWLRFKCDEETLRDIQKSKGFNVATGHNPRWAPGAIDRGLNPNAPDWWWDVDAKTEFREFEKELSKDHGSDLAHIWIDPATKTVFATRDVID